MQKKLIVFFGILFIDWGNHVYIIHMCVPTDQPWKNQMNIYMRFALHCKNALVFQRYNNVLILKFSPCFERCQFDYDNYSFIFCFISI